MPRSRARRSDDSAPAGGDLLEQRDTFIHTFFRKGAALTEELIREDERLRARLGALEAENALLRAQVESDDAIRDLLGKIQQLEGDKRDLLSRFREAQATHSHFSDRVAEIEAENARLASLYVASYQLHSTLDLNAVVRQLRELLAQFVGAASFGVYLIDADREELVPIASEGVPPASLVRVRRAEGPIGETFAGGGAQWTEDDPTRGSVDDPAALVPLRLGEHTVGVIAVFSTFEQKRAFVDLDFELFRLLGAHAASALVAARLFTQHGSQIGAVEAFARARDAG